VHTKPDILLIDEILAVGDESFKAKCFRKMEEFKKEGVTIVLVSHALESVKKFCSKTILLHNHEIKMSGKSEIVCDKYINNFLK